MSEPPQRRGMLRTVVRRRATHVLGVLIAAIAASAGILPFFFPTAPNFPTLVSDLAQEIRAGIPVIGDVLGTAWFGAALIIVLAAGCGAFVLRRWHGALHRALGWMRVRVSGAVHAKALEDRRSQVALIAAVVLLVLRVVSGFLRCLPPGTSGPLSRSTPGMTGVVNNAPEEPSVTAGPGTPTSTLRPRQPTPTGSATVPAGKPTSTSSATAAAGTTPTPTSRPTPVPATVIEYLGSAGNVGLSDITSGSDGALWFTEYYGAKIGRITTSGSYSGYPVPTSSRDLCVITSEPDGALWFREANGVKIGRITTSGNLTEYPVPTANAVPQGITTGPDEALWLGEGNSNIGRITTSGSLSEYSVVAATSGACDLTSGPAGDGALWFTEDSCGKIGRMVP